MGRINDERWSLVVVLLDRYATTAAGRPFN
jgi:hypothetical protein